MFRGLKIPITQPKDFQRVNFKTISSFFDRIFR